MVTQLIMIGGGVTNSDEMGWVLLVKYALERDGFRIGQVDRPSYCPRVR